MAKRDTNQDTSPLIRIISDLTVRIARRTLGAEKDQMDRLNSALILANNALALVEKSPKDARKIIDIMRRMTNIRD